MHKKTRVDLCILLICLENFKKHLEIAAKKVYHIYRKIYFERNTVI